MKKQKIFLLLIAIFSLLSCMSSMETTYAYTDGPWITKQDETNKYIISWTTGTPRNSTIFWGRSENNLDNKFISEKSRNHRLELENLEEGKYYYTILEDLTKFPKGHIFNFTVSYPKKSKVVIMGDIQVRNVESSKMSELVANAVKRENPDAVIQLGDLVEVPWFTSSWHEAMKVINIFSGERPFYAVVGNHEQINGDFFNYKKVFPNNYANKDATYYSFSIGDAFFISMDYCDAGYEKVSQKQIEWVEKKIISAKEKNKKWIFFLFHGNILDTHPMLQETAIQKWLIPLADKYEIDGVFTGHSHGYQHWEYEYGHDNLLYNKNDKPSGKKIPYWCAASSGATLFVNYGLLNFNRTNSVDMYNTKTKKTEELEIICKKWNPKNFIDYRNNIYYGQPFLFAGKHFFHDPDIENYCNQNQHFGFVYGEQTSHYMVVEIDSKTCKISAHYADGTIISGPNKDKKQEWIFTK